ncbi:LOW QUALITY PROTEIN: E3 ubiquitin-protein ligase RNF14-like [Aulostomus maculatus]
MNVDLEEQEDELLALSSILGSEEFVRHESKCAGEIRVTSELPAGFTVALREGETLRHDEITFLPPLLLTFVLPEDYPSSSPPSFTLTCIWLTHKQVMSTSHLTALQAHLIQLYQASGGAVVLFSWVQFLKEDALRFLDIASLLELSSDDHGGNQASLSASSIGHGMLVSGCDTEWVDDGSQGAEVIDPEEGDPDQLTSSAQDCDQEEILKVERQNDPPDQSAKRERLPVTQSDQIRQNHLQNELENEELSVPPLSSQVPLAGEVEGGAEYECTSLAAHASQSLSTKNQTFSGLSLTPVQALLSQLLIYDAAHKQKVFASTVFDCSVCYTCWLGSECVQLDECGHVFCRACLAEFCKLQITEGNVWGVTCPHADCSAFPTPAQVKSLVGEELFSRYDRLLLQSSLDLMPDVVYCPRPSCASAVILDKASRVALCSVCRFAFCVTCKKANHGERTARRGRVRQSGLKKTHSKLTLTCPNQKCCVAVCVSEGIMALWEDYTQGSKERRRLLKCRYGAGALSSSVADCLSQNWINQNSKTCPHCFSRIQKNGGCNMMTCSQCRRLFCWACLAKVPPNTGVSHFSESSCPGS